MNFLTFVKPRVSWVAGPQEGAEGCQQQEDDRKSAREDQDGARQAGRGGRGAQAHRRDDPQDEGRAVRDRQEAWSAWPLEDGPGRAGQEARPEV